MSCQKITNLKFQEFVNFYILKSKTLLKLDLEEKIYFSALSNLDHSFLV